MEKKINCLFFSNFFLRFKVFRLCLCVDVCFFSACLFVEKWKGMVKDEEGKEDGVFLVG